MIAQPIGVQSALEFFVAIFTLATFGILIVGRSWQDGGSDAIGDHRTPIGSLPIGLAFDDGEAGM